MLCTPASLRSLQAPNLKTKCRRKGPIIRSHFFFHLIAFSHYISHSIICIAGSGANLLFIAPTRVQRENISRKVRSATKVSDMNQPWWLGSLAGQLSLGSCVLAIGGSNPAWAMNGTGR